MSSTFSRINQEVIKQLEIFEDATTIDGEGDFLLPPAEHGDELMNVRILVPEDMDSSGLIEISIKIPFHLQNLPQINGAMHYMALLHDTPYN